MSTLKTIQSALISVFSKDGLEPIVRKLHEQNVTLYSTGGTEDFIKNLGILSAILTHKPKSIYELAKLVEMDISNLNKIVIFFESIGAIKIKTSTVSGRTVKTPIVEYGHIEFDLMAA